ncbi:TlpA family protein disulfide reductase [Laceyella putida]|jgi:thiol-disulfide isomerase/thioredoxin|uniref:TlpA family protein disulfide reductase n=1 Tax=Laceyella putida TaxID=110101 RepID=A0ABW2RN68_9BACL
MKGKNLIVLCVLLALAGAALWTVTQDKQKVDVVGGTQATSSVQCKGEARPEEGYCAPNFTLKTIDGKEVELYRNHGKPTVINFWATWCPPCKKEMPYFQKAYAQYKDKLNFIMVNETSQEKDEAQIKAYLDKYRYTFPVALDPLKDKKTVGFDLYGLYGLPSTYVVGADGKILYRFIGGIEEEQIFMLMQELSR